MTNVEIKHLVRSRRLPENELKILCLLLYLPVGVILFILRSILALCLVLIGCGLSDTPVIHKLVNRIACLVLGITVTVENPEKKEHVEVYVSNNLSIFDHLSVHTATGAVSPGSKMHPVLSRGLGIHHFGNQSNLEQFKKNVVTLISEQKIPIYFNPEDKITNGKALLKFKTFPFSLTSKIQPICLKIERPFLNIAVTKMGATYWSDVMLFMFSPLTNYKIKFLPPMEKKSLQDGEFSEICRQAIATALKVELVDFSAADVLEWEKRKLAEDRAMPRPSTSSIEGEIRRMALQVKEVLPHVPLNAIYKDLSKTRNVDNTITNILEGRVQFVAEPPTIHQPSTSSSSANEGIAMALPPSSSGDFNTAASTFAKSAQERNRSFQERKELLIANARRRYIEKHGLEDVKN